MNIEDGNIEGPSTNNKGNNTPEERSMVDEAIRLGGKITDEAPMEEPIEEQKGVIRENMGQGKEELITEDGSRYDTEGNLILKGSDD